MFRMSKACPILADAQGIANRPRREGFHPLPSPPPEGEGICLNQDVQDYSPILYIL